MGHPCKAAFSRQLSAFSTDPVLAGPPRLAPWGYRLVLATRACDEGACIESPRLAPWGYCLVPAPRGYPAGGAVGTEEGAPLKCSFQPSAISFQPDPTLAGNTGTRLGWGTPERQLSAVSYQLSARSHPSGGNPPRRTSFYRGFAAYLISRKMGGRDSRG